jgi:hypothetical protein
MLSLAELTINCGQKQQISVSLPLTFSAKESLAKRLIPAQIFVRIKFKPYQDHRKPFTECLVLSSIIIYSCLAEKL